ncbi:hypothetical protein L208DRAFT_1414126 [Tricholoma matsutake]|nr:hypothetical protein L208DRAFT_1414126 [Tricholoma matsutake 945]
MHPNHHEEMHLRTECGAQSVLVKGYGLVNLREMHLCTECGAQSVLVKGYGLTHALLPRLTPTH